MSEKKLNLFDWYESQECKEGETPNTTWIKGFATQGAWETYSTLEPIHDGDCVKRPYACNLCALEKMLREYREYCFQ